eukprot:c19207_g1_i1.p1 GENE.c19207_g1_i1~~c19207_g1_i1.p1  ORF type:complete len:124 (-),score=6.26 c19207_g1_i1:104-475(-)
MSTVWGRAESLVRDQPEFRDHFTIVVSRGVCELQGLLELCMPLCQIGGCLLFPKTLRKSFDEIGRAKHALHVLGGELSAVVPVSKLLPYRETELDVNPAIVVIQKTQKTPIRFPRQNYQVDPL